MSHKIADHPWTWSEKACRAWEAEPTDQKKYSSEFPKLVGINHEGTATQALILSQYLANKMLRALCLGRQYRTLAMEEKRLKHQFNLGRLDAEAEIECMDFALERKKKEMELTGATEDEQIKDLMKVARRVHGLKANIVTIRGDMILLDKTLEDGLNAWKKAWLHVDKVLDDVWAEDGLL